MKVAILGSGSGAHIIAYAWAAAGHSVYMYNLEQYSEPLDAVSVAGGIYCTGEIEGFQKIEYAGSDLNRVMDGTDLIFVIVPAYGIEEMGNLCAEYIRAGQTFVVIQGSCMGALLFKNALGLAISNSRITVAETSTLPYMTRVTGPARVNVFACMPAGYMVAALPRAKSADVHAMLRPVFTGIEKAESILQTTMQNCNPVIHPAITTLNAALIERSNGDFFYFSEGVTPAVARIMKTIDEERMEIARLLGLPIESCLDLGIRQEDIAIHDYYLGYSQSYRFDGLISQSTLDYRYYNEDVGTIMTFWVELADALGVPVPAMKSLINLVSIIMDRDYTSTAPITLKKLGLENAKLEDFMKI